MGERRGHFAGELGGRGFAAGGFLCQAACRAETPAPEAGTVVSTVETPAPEADTAVSTVEAPVPEAATMVSIVETPVPEAETVVSTAETPAPEAGTVVSIVETPVSEAETAVSIVEAPVREAGTAAPKVETPVSGARICSVGIPAATFLTEAAGRAVCPAGAIADPVGRTAEFFGTCSALEIAGLLRGILCNALRA